MRSPIGVSCERPIRDRVVEVALRMCELDPDCCGAARREELLNFPLARAREYVRQRVELVQVALDADHLLTRDLASSRSALEDGTSTDVAAAMSKTRPRRGVLDLHERI